MGRIVRLSLRDPLHLSAAGRAKEIRSRKWLRSSCREIFCELRAVVDGVNREIARLELHASAQFTKICAARSCASNR